MSTKRPDRDEYPDPNLSDLRDAVQAALEASEGEHPWAHHVRGRYTAHRTWTEHSPDMKPGDKHVTIRVVECDRDVILNVPEEFAGSVLQLLEQAPVDDDRDQDHEHGD